jgi:methyl acetate hydrolase
MTKVDQLLRDAVEHGDAIGVSAVAVDASGIRYLGAAGLQDSNTKAAMTENSIVRIASMTKAVTSVAAMQQVERGTIGLHEPISQLLPALHKAPVLDGFSNTGEPILRPLRRPITLHHLLTHTSGLAYTIWNEALGKYRTREPDARPIDGPDLRLSLPLVFDPGERWEYGTNTEWAGFAVEKAAQLSLGEYMQQNIFSPLAMHDSAFSACDESRQSSVYRRESDGTLKVIAPGNLPTPPYQGGGSGLFSTALDYGKFLRALLGSGDTALVKPQTLSLMKENHIGELSAGTFAAFERDRSNDVAMLTKTHPKWSLFGLINPQAIPGGRAAGSVCWGGLFNSYYWVDSTQQVAGAIFTQTLPFYDARIVALYERFERLIYA